MPGQASLAYFFFLGSGNEGPLSTGVSWGWTTGGGGAISTSGAGLGNAKPNLDAKADENNNVLGVPESCWISGPAK